MRRSALTLLALVSLAACDSETPPDGPVTFQGVEVAAEGDATISVRDGLLVVSGLDGARAGGFAVAGRPDRVDVEIAPLSIPVGGRFGVEVRDGSDPVVSLANRATSAGRFDVEFDVPSLLGATAAIVRYRLNGEVRFEGRLDVVPGRTRGQRRPTSAGSGEGDTGSTHVVRERGKYVVVSDSDSGGARRAGGCSGFLMTPPPPLDLSVEGPICADWVEVEPLATAPVPQGTVSVVAQGVGSFTVRQLDVQ